MAREVKQITADLRFKPLSSKVSLHSLLEMHKWKCYLDCVLDLSPLGEHPQPS